MPCWHRMPALSTGATHGSPTRARESIRVQSRAARPGWPTGGPAGRPRRRARPDVRAGRPNARTGPGERGGRPSGRHGPGGQSVRTAHGPGGVAGRADAVGGPGGQAAGPGRTSGPGGVTAMRVREDCCAAEAIAVRCSLIARQTAQRVRARASWRLLAAGAARGAHGAVHRRHRAGGGGLGAWSTARTGWRLQAEELRVAAMGYSRGVFKGCQGLHGAPVKTL